MKLPPLLLAGLLFAGPSVRHLEAADTADAGDRLARRILADPDLPWIVEQARALLKTGLNAGSGYGEVWIRDLNTFIEISLEVNPRNDLREALVQFFRFQGPSGDIPDGYIPRDRGSAGYRYRSSPLAPDHLAHKNTVETDQESSLVQAVRKYVAATGDRTLLKETVDGLPVLDRLDRALGYLLAERFDHGHGLIWGATTADWGDVQPEHPWGVELDAGSHRALDIYDNAMLLVAIGDLLELLPADSSRVTHWRAVRSSLRANIRWHLWDGRRQKFIPHVYLAGSPFPADFDEGAIHVHGGTTVAMEADLLSRAEVGQAVNAMVRNVRLAGAASIGLTLYPPYPAGFFKNPSMGPHSYQNGGDWSWFGGRTVRQLIRHGFVNEAYTELKPMVARVRRTGDFYEWWTPDNRPQGSRQFRGSAGVLGKAAEELLAWARNRRTGPSPP